MVASKIKLNEFKNFIGYEVSRELIFWNAFDDAISEYSQGFELVVDNKSGILTWGQYI